MIWLTFITGDGKLGDKAAQAEGKDIAAGPAVQAEGGGIRMDGLEPGQIDRRYHKGGHLSDHCGDGSTLYPI